MIGWKRLVAVVVAAVTTWSCSPDTPNEPKVGRSDVLKAMMAIRAHGDARLAATAERLPSLDAAVETIRNDASPGAASRRRRALAMLLARSWDTEPPAGLGERLGARVLEHVKAAITERLS